MRSETKHTMDPVLRSHPTDSQTARMPKEALSCTYLSLLDKNCQVYCRESIQHMFAGRFHPPPQPPLFPLQKTDIVTCGWTMKTYVFFSQSSLVLARSGCSVRVTHFHLLVISHSKTIQQRRNCFHSIHPCNMNKLTLVFVSN